MQVWSLTEGPAALSHLLSQGDGVSQLRCLEVGKEIVVKDQGIWVPARLIGYRATDISGKIWRCRRSYHKGVQEYKRTFKQEQHDWGVTRDDNVQLDLNGPGVKVVRSSGQHTCSLIESPCKERNGNKVLMYHEELKYLVRRMPFKWGHGIEVTSLGTEYN